MSRVWLTCKEKYTVKVLINGLEQRWKKSWGIFEKSLHLSKLQLNKIRRISTISGLGFFQGMVHVSQGGITSNLSPLVPRKYLEFQYSLLKIIFFAENLKKRHEFEFNKIFSGQGFRLKLAYKCPNMISNSLSKFKAKIESIHVSLSRSLQSFQTYIRFFSSNCGLQFGSVSQRKKMYFKIEKIGLNVNNLSLL